MKLCECGCGLVAPLATKTATKRGLRRGEPQRFVRGHYQRTVMCIRGPGSTNWRGGRAKTSLGYIEVYVSQDDPLLEMASLRGGAYYALEHRIVMARHVGRLLRSDESVHHRNGVRDDNRIENLELWTSVHPGGQRVSDLVAWAHEILARYEEIQPVVTPG